MTCKNCNREIPEGSTVCPYCGSAVQPVENTGFKKAGGFNNESAGSFNPAVKKAEIHPSAKCSNCGALLNEGIQFCSNCGANVGTAVPQTSFCGHCGSKIPANVDFCPECGASLKSAAAPAASTGKAYASRKPLTKNERYIKFGLIGIIAIVAVILCFTLFGGRSYEKVVETMVKATFEADGKAMMSLLPDKYIEYGCEQDNITRAEAEDKIEEELESTLKYIDGLTDDWDYHYEIIETEDYDKDELGDLQEYCEDTFDFKVKDAKQITVKFTVSIGGEDVNSNSSNFTVIKVGNSWYLWNTGLL